MAAMMSNMVFSSLNREPGGALLIREPRSRNNFLKISKIIFGRVFEKFCRQSVLQCVTDFSRYKDKIMANHEDQANTTVSTGHLAISHFAQVADYLDRHEWACTSNEEQGLFSIALSSAAATYWMYIKTSYTSSICNIMVISVLPVKAPAVRRPAIAESLQRINFTLMQGTAELDFSNGEIRFRTLATTEGASLSDTLLDYVIDSSFYLAHRYTAPLLAVAFGNAAPDFVLDMAQVPVATTLQ